MELSYLRHFKVVAELENMTKAAQQLHMSQPGLSKSISKLESQLGVMLFERQGGRLKLSPIGAEFYGYIARAFEQIAAGEHRIAAYLEQENGAIRIASPISDLLHTLVSDFLVCHPERDISISQFIYTPEILERKLLENELDFIITPIYIDNNQLEAQIALDEEVFLVVSKKHHLANQKTVQLKSLSQERFLVDESIFDSKIVSHHCEKVGFTPKITLCSSESPLILETLSDNRGVCFIPASMLAGIPDTEKSFVPLRVSDINVFRIIFLIKRRDRILSQNARSLYTHSKGFFKLLAERIKIYPMSLFEYVPPPSPVTLFPRPLV